MRDLKFNPNAQDAASAHLKYRAYVDGLRAVAVLPVLFFHADLGCPGGYVGVDIFFVISGYLITGLILKDFNAGQFHIVKFWERRVRRILPAITVVVLATLIAGWFLLLPRGFKELGESAAAQALLVSNIYFWIKSWIGAGYFTPAAEVKPLLHTWSLAVEEQFYLFFPFLLIAFKRFSRKSIVPAILWFSGVSFGFSVYCSYFYPSFNFYFLPPRAWELLLGAFLAAIPSQPRPPARGWMTESLSWGGLLAILWAVFIYDRETRFPGVSALLPCVGAALILWANGHTLTSVGKLLALRPVVFFGLISYSLYLWHWPVLVFFKYWAIDPVPASQRLLLLLASVGLAVLSWKFVETPFRRRAIFKTRSQIFAFAGSATAVLLLSGLAVFRFHGLPSRLPVTAQQYDNIESRVAFDHDLSLKQALAGDFIEIGTADKKRAINLLVWGDSHAMAVMPVLIALCKEYSIRGVAATHSATPPLIGYESKKSDLKLENINYNNAIAAFVRTNRVHNLILIANWGAYMTDADETARLHSSLIDTIRILRETDAQIWILRQIPKPPWNVPSVLAATVWRGGEFQKLGFPLADYRTEVRHQNTIYEGITTAISGVTVLNPADLFVNTNNLFPVVKDGKALYCDDSHLTEAGAMLLRPLFEPILAGIGKDPSRSGIKDATR